MKVVAWLVIYSDVNPSIHQPVREALNLLLRSCEKALRHRGIKGMMEHMKSCRLSLLYHLSGEYPSKQVKGVRVTSDGIPKVLKPLFEILREGSSRTAQAARLILTFLFSTRAITMTPKPDITSIVAPGKGTSAIDASAMEFWSQGLGFRLKSSSQVSRAVLFRRPHFTTKSGPNGHALKTSTVDLELLYKEENILLKESIYKVGGPKLQDFMDSVIGKCGLINKALRNTSGGILRKISWFPDKDGKTRVVAILDYYSQMCLFPLHSFLMRVLKNIPQDCTYDQGSFYDKINGWDEFYSIDLTAATDRFPITVICQVLKGYLPHDWVEAWKIVMVSKSFRFIDENGRVDQLYYSVGNPMGAYSSWPSFALAHHFVMYSCCRKLNMEWKESKYVMLGDDILIGDRLLAEAYKETILSLGVSFSPLKTHESRTLCEFAKRYVYKGQEITPFPIAALGEVSKKFYFMVPLAFQELRRNWNFPKGVPELVSSYYSHVLGYNGRYCRHIGDLSLVCEQLMLCISGKLTASDSLRAIAGRLALPLRQLPNDQANNLIQSIVVELFTASNPENGSDQGTPLGDLAINLTCLLTGGETDEDLMWACDNLHKVPILNCYGSVEETYLKMKKEAYRIDTIGSGEWPLFLRTIAIPLTDRVFVERQIHTLSRASSLLAFKLLKNLTMMLRYPWYSKDVAIEGYVARENYIPEVLGFRAKYRKSLEEF
jgi:hypothetical protein